MLRMRAEQGPDFPVVGGCVSYVGADLDESHISLGTAGVEIHFEAVTGVKVTALIAAALQFQDHHRFKCVAKVGVPSRFIKGNLAFLAVPIIPLRERLRGPVILPSYSRMDVLATGSEPKTQPVV